jgi:hypothetical protein
MSNETTQTLSVGLHYGVPASVYHADPCETPSLSSGALRVLLSKSPAHAAMEHPRLGGIKRESSPAMDTGSLVHAILSGSQDEISVGSFADYKTKAAQTWREETRETGKIPVLAEAYEAAQKVADHVRRRCALGTTQSPFSSPSARHEVTGIWKDGDAFCRARYDLLEIDQYTADVWDWKSTRDISNRGIDKSIKNLRYDIQQEFYLRGLSILAPGRVQSFVFIFFETVQPYTVRRAVISPSYRAQANRDITRGVTLWQQCLRDGQFPVLPPDTYTAEIPAYLDEDDGEIEITD